MDAWGYLSQADKDEFERLDAAFARNEPMSGERSETFGLWAHTRFCANPDDPRRLALLGQVIDHPPAWSGNTVSGLWRTFCDQTYRSAERAEALSLLPLAATARLSYPDRRVALHWVPDGIRQYREQVWPLLRDRLTELFAEPETDDPVAAVRNVLWDDDAFTTTLAAEFASRPAAPGTLPLLRHCATATASKPSARWLARTARLLDARAGELIADVLRRLVAHREYRICHTYRDEEWAETVFLRERTAVALRGMVWACELVDEPWVTGLLGDVAVTTGTGMGGSGANARSEMLANAAIGVLARRGGIEVVAQLARVQAKVRKKAILALVGRTLEAVAAQNGLSSEQLLERTVPTFGLDHDGTRTEQGLRLSLTGAITYNGRKTIPKTVDRELLAEFRATAKELKKAVPAERFRVERALAAGRNWRWSEVCDHYLDHPVTGSFGRNLIWEISQGPVGLPVWDAGAWELAGPAGRRVRPRPDDEVVLWHPITHTLDEVRAWRDRLLEIGVRQPFKQAFREVYLLTPAEEEAGDRSRRFAGHLLRYGQAKALLTERGWTGLSLGHWGWEYGSDEAEAVRQLPGGLAVHWDFHLDEESFERDGAGHTASVCVSGELWFTSPTGARLPLPEVPALTFSEALRDADLAAGVTSTGLDPEGQGDYWRSYGFGDLSENARVRRDALARLLPRLAIAERCALTDRFLVVRGELRTYKIHLGSGNILMEPNDAYLCIVPRGSGDRVFLPFEEDGGLLSVIVSKAFLLAADNEINDPTIVRQIRS
ncbi:DUF4132 domain-containing protein [Microbispora rosea]|uniref:DUF4132 domain-containing protein n=1 Tax=Microbispora rosea TaxID=58117 RepID=UPI0037A48555